MSEYQERGEGTKFPSVFLANRHRASAGTESHIAGKKSLWQLNIERPGTDAIPFDENGAWQ
jgi:hypothetical protein